MNTATTDSHLPDLDSAHALEAQQTAFYQKHGWVLLRGLCDPGEADAYRTVIRDAAMTHNRQTKPLAERDTYGKAFLQISNLWQKDPLAAKFACARRFAKVAADLMGVRGVRLYHDQALFKEPGGGPTPWHQDQYYWPLDGVKTTTLWMPMVDAGADMGTMRFANGSQNLVYLGALPISDESEKQWGALIAERGLSVTSAGAMCAGDATFHNGWTLHGAPANNSPTITREVMTIIYFEDGATISAPDHKSRENDLAAWFPGRKPGDLAATDLNPLLYHRENR